MDTHLSDLDDHLRNILNQFHPSISLSVFFFLHTER